MVNTNPNGQDRSLTRFKVYALIPKDSKDSKIYIGRTTLTLERRLSDHKRQFKVNGFHKAHDNIKADGLTIDDFNIHLIGAYKSKSKMLEMEKHFIKQQSNLYNFRDGTIWITEESKDKMRKSKLGKLRGPYKGNAEYCEQTIKLHEQKD